MHLLRGSTACCARSRVSASESAERQVTVESRQKRKSPKQPLVRPQDPPKEPEAPRVGALPLCQPLKEPSQSTAGDSEVRSATAATREVSRASMWKNRFDVCGQNSNQDPSPLIALACSVNPGRACFLFGVCRDLGMQSRRWERRKQAPGKALKWKQARGSHEEPRVSGRGAFAFLRGQYPLPLPS